VGSAAKKSGKELSVMIQILKEKGIEANAETSLRTIADKLGVTPRDVYTMLTSK
jgi:DNA-binding MarR family transcriptional regulator